MKTWNKVDPDDLREIAKELVDGIWGPDKSIDAPIKFNTETSVENTKDLANLSLKEIHEERIKRIAANQWKHRNLDLLLLGVTDQELASIQAVIEIGLREYLRPLADLIGVWDEDKEEDPETPEKVEPLHGPPMSKEEQVVNLKLTKRETEEIRKAMRRRSKKGKK
jgi:hypothetical protein